MSQPKRQGRLLLDTSRMSYEVSVVPVPKMDPKTGRQKVDSETQLPMWTVHLYALGEDTGEVLNVTVVAEQKPAVTVRQPVVPVDLEALPWVNNRDGQVRSGVAFRCQGLRLVEAAAAAK